jgi:hypothetical protein
MSKCVLDAFKETFEDEEGDEQKVIEFKRLCELSYSRTVVSSSDDIGISFKLEMNNVPAPNATAPFEWTETGMYLKFIDVVSRRLHGLRKWNYLLSSG